MSSKKTTADPDLSSGMRSSEDMTNQKYDDLLFGVRRSIRYHSRRQAFFEGVNRWTDFLLLALGSGTVALAVQDRPSWILGLGLGVALVSSLKLVFAFGVKATQHAQFVRDFTLLEKRLCTDASGETVKAVTQERLDLEALEPPVMQVLDVLCHNDLLRAMGYADEKEQVAVTWWQRQTAQFFNFGTHRLAKGG